MPRCAGELGQTETEKAGSGLRDGHPENQTNDAPAVRTWPCLDNTETPHPAQGHAGAPARGEATAEHTRTRTRTHGHARVDTRADTHVGTCSRGQAREGGGD